jgi:hypothetical protein
VALPLEHRGLGCEIRFDQAGGVYVGRVLVSDRVVNFSSVERDGVIAAFHAAVDAYLETPEAFAAPRVSPARAGEPPSGGGELRYDTWRNVGGR